MAKVTLNKSSLNIQRRKVKAYRQFLPALELKRKQLLAEQTKVRNAIATRQHQIDTLTQTVAEQLPMLATLDVNVNEVVTVERFELEQINLVGIMLPRIKHLDIGVQPYSFLQTPAWFDTFVDLLKQQLQLITEQKVADFYLAEVAVGLKKTTQRLNLFEKVLIPQAQKHIKKIQIALSDAERAEVVRAKIAKNKRARMAIA